MKPPRKQPALWRAERIEAPKNEEVEDADAFPTELTLRKKYRLPGVRRKVVLWRQIGGISGDIFVEVRCLT